MADDLFTNAEVCFAAGMLGLPKAVLDHDIVVV